MRVLLTYDALTQKHGGVSRYAVELARALRAVGVDATLFAGLNDNDYVKGFRTPRFRGRNRVNSLAQSAVTRLRSFDVVHATMPDRPVHRQKPRVVTVYDTITLEAPEQFDHAHTRNARLAEWVRRADLVLTPTAATRQRLCELLGGDPDRIVVTPFGVRVDDLEPVLTNGPPFYLYVGDRQGYKNFGALLDAVTGLPSEVRVRCLGGGPLTTLEAQHPGARLVDVHPVVSDRALDAHYRSALGLVSTSQHEGFGFPVLEAMARGCPVICSDIPSHREIAGDAARFFDPRSSEQLAALLTADNDSRARVAVGLDRASGFTWERTATLTAAAYRSVVRPQ